MQTMRNLASKLGYVPASAVVQLGNIDAVQGQERLYRKQSPSTLERLVETARLQSAESSNAIEGVVAPRKRIRELMDERVTPRNRSEAEIAGYRSVLDQVHRNSAEMPLSNSYILQMHRDLYRHVGGMGGAWKVTDNHIEERHPDGRTVIVFRALPAVGTPAAMVELHDLTNRAWNDGQNHRLLIAGSYILDFLCIHPFLDGNGRMSRLLTLLLLYHGGYEVGRYVSIEKAIEDSKETYYEALRASSWGWSDGEHDPWPWLEYFLGILVVVYRQFEERVGVFGGRGAMSDSIDAFIASVLIGETFKIAEVRAIAAGASDSHISKVLARARDAGQIASQGRGRSAHWIKL